MRVAVTNAFVVLLLFALTAPAAWAGSDAGELGLLGPEAERSARTFGYAGVRPLDPTTSVGIARPTPAPPVETAAFGAATASLPARSLAKVVTPTPAPAVRVAADGACATCCPPCPTTRVADDPLSVPTVYWSSGYHDGEPVRRCDPCAPRPVYRPPCEPCDPCDRPLRVVRRCATPCYAPCVVPYRRWCGPRVRIAVAPRWGWGGWGWGLGWGWGGCW